MDRGGKGNETGGGKRNGSTGGTAVGRDCYGTSLLFGPPCKYNTQFPLDFTEV